MANRTNKMTPDDVEDIRIFMKALSEVMTEREASRLSCFFLDACYLMKTIYDNADMDRVDTKGIGLVGLMKLYKILRLNKRLVYALMSIEDEGVPILEGDQY